MKHLITIICLLIVACNGAGGDNADDYIPGAGSEDYPPTEYVESYMMPSETNRAFADADKIGYGDNNLCWAAVAANMLTWSKWAADENDTFDIFRLYFDDQIGYVYDALIYYFDSYTEYEAPFFTVRENRPGIIIDFIITKLHQNLATAIKIENAITKKGHYLTIYGYRRAATENRFTLYYTDSDDMEYKINSFDIKYNKELNAWQIDHPYRKHYIHYAISLSTIY